jgi:hypothetical protein
MLGEPPRAIREIARGAPIFGPLQFLDSRTRPSGFPEFPDRLSDPVRASTISRMDARRRPGTTKNPDRVAPDPGLICLPCPAAGSALTESPGTT